MATSTRYIGFCPVCQHDIKVRSGTLVHHGYKRPGIGFILGDCFGVNRPPHELSPETAQLFLAEVIDPELRSARSVVAFLKDPPYLMFPKEENGRRVYDSRGEPVTERREQRDVPAWKWEQQLDRARRDADDTVRGFEEERSRLTGLISTWQLVPLKTEEEEVAKHSEVRASRGAKVQADREQKSAEALVLLRAQVDRAVKKRDVYALHDLFDHQWSKVAEPLRAGYGTRSPLTRDGVLRLLERDDVWRALGWMQGEDYPPKGQVDWRSLKAVSVDWPAPPPDPELERVKADRAGRSTAKREAELAKAVVAQQARIDQALAVLRTRPAGSEASRSAMWNLGYYFGEADYHAKKIPARMPMEAKRTEWLRLLDRDAVWSALGWIRPDGSYVKSVVVSHDTPVPPELQ